MSNQAAGAPAPPNTWPSRGITSQLHLRDIICVPKAQDLLSGFKVCGVLCVGTSNQTHVSDNKENSLFYPQAGSTPPPSFFLVFPFSLCVQELTLDKKLNF